MLPFDADTAQGCSRLRVPCAEDELDKHVAAPALVHGLTVVTRKTRGFAGTGVALLNPFKTA